MDTPHETANNPLALLGELLEQNRLGSHHSAVQVTITRNGPDIADVRLPDGRRGRLAATDFYPNRRWQENARWMAVIVDEKSTPARVSCTHPDLVRILMEAQVPEIRSGQVRIMGVARRPGIRTKISVAGTEAQVDAVGASLGRAAIRSRTVSQQLGGERIDVVAWHPDPLVHATNALAVRAVRTQTDENGHAIIAVPPYQLEAAHGGGNLNLHLAAQLAGLRIQLLSAL